MQSTNDNKTRDVTRSENERYSLIESLTDQPTDISGVSYYLYSNCQLFIQDIIR